MAWTNSKMFRRTLSELLSNVNAWDFDIDAMKVALYVGTITPDNNVTTDELHRYNGTGSQWVVANEVSGIGWAAGGVSLAGQSVSVANTDRVVFDGNDTASSAGATIGANQGCLLYNTVTQGVTNRGISYHYFGGAQQVTNGTFTIVWHTNGILNFTL